MKFKLRRYFLYYLGRGLAFLFYLIPLRAGVAIGGFLGGLAFYIVGKYRRAAIENLEAAFGSRKAGPEVRAIAKKAFKNLGKNAAELVNFPKINKSNIEKLVKIKNIDILDRALEKGKGAIILTGHFGNWELLAATLRLKGYPGAAIGRRIYFDKYDAYLNSLRRIHDLNVIYRDESPKKILRVLKDNGVMGMLADQDVDSVDGVFVDFFGKPAYTPTAPVALARASGAALIPTFVIRANCHHSLVMEEPVELVDTGDKEKDLAENTKRWSDVFESYIRRYPEQWVWMHRRWKTKPQ